MEELTISSDEHGTPDEEMECMATMEDITIDDKNYCEYQTAPSGRWHKSKYAAGTVRRLITHQFPEYVEGVRKADCAADLKRRLAAGPPIYVSDKHALPVPEDDTHIERIWFAEDGKEYSAKLKGCVEVRASACATNVGLPRFRRRTARTSTSELLAATACCLPYRSPFACLCLPTPCVLGCRA